MQHFFQPFTPILGLLAQATPAPETAESVLRQIRELPAAHGGSLLLTIVVGQLIWIISYWVASKPVAGDESAFGNAFKVWLFYLVTRLGLVLVAGLGCVVAFFMHIPVAIAVIMPITILLLFVIAFAVPMKVYDIGFFAALGFLILAFILGVIGNVGMDLLYGHRMGPVMAIVQKVAALTPEERKKLMEMVTHENAGRATGPERRFRAKRKVAGDRSKPLAEREAAVKMMYFELEKRRKSLKPGDTVATGTYNEQRARYEEILKQLKADAAAPHQPAR